MLTAITVLTLSIIIFYILFYGSGFIWKKGYDYGYKKGYMSGGVDSLGIMAGLMLLSKEEREDLMERALKGEDPLKLLKNKLKEKGLD